MNITESIDNYNIIKKQTDKFIVRNKVFEENDKHIRKDMFLNKGDWERMTLSVSIYDYIMTIFLVYVITSVISYYFKINDIGYYKYGITIISFLVYLACICFRYNNIKWKMKYTGKYYLNFVILGTELLIATILSAINYVCIHKIVDIKLEVTTYIITGASLVIISLGVLFLYKNKNGKNDLKLTISKEITEQEEKEEHIDDILITGGIEVILNNGNSRTIDFKKRIYT